MTKTLTAPTTTTPELHGVALIHAILERKLATATAALDAERAGLRENPAIPELREKLAAFVAECDGDLAEWAGIKTGLAARVGLAGLDVIRGIPERAARLRDHVRHAQARLAAIPGLIDAMTIDDIGTVTHAVQHELMLAGEIPSEAWSEYRALAKMLASWEAEHVA